jgi:hypothetical protein
MNSFIFNFLWLLRYIQFQKALSYTSIDYTPNKHLTEEHITQTNRHRLCLKVVIQRRLSKLTANTRLLVPTEWKSPVKSVVCVDPDGTGA